MIAQSVLHRLGHVFTAHRLFKDKIISQQSMTIVLSEMSQTVASVPFNSDHCLSYYLR